MITRLDLINFRGVREGGITGLSPLSILVGPNNAGKSTCLEALAIVASGTDTRGIAQLLIRRGGPPLDALVRAVSSNDVVHELKVTSLEDGDRERTCSSKLSFGGVRNTQHIDHARQEGIKEPFVPFNVIASELTKIADIQQGTRYGQAVSHVGPDGHASTTLIFNGSAVDCFPASVVDADTIRTGLEEAYTRLEDNGRRALVVTALARSMPDLVDFRILKTRDDFVLHTIHRDRAPLPAYLMGDGFKRFLAVAARVLGANGTIALVEEPESFQHPRYLEELATLFVQGAEKGVQIIMSTHSLEFIDLLLQVAAQKNLLFPTVHRLRLIDGVLGATTVSRELAAAARDDLAQDLRA